jgi:two-component system chemotaxis response regulator CheY
MNVLVVEDSEVMRGMIVKALKNGGLPVREVYQAANGLEALQSLREHSVDLVFMDLNMPVMDGETFLRKVRAEAATADTPVVVVSSNGNSAVALGLESLGATFVQKPFTAQTLRAAAENALGARQ